MESDQRGLFRTDVQPTETALVLPRPTIFEAGGPCLTSAMDSSPRAGGPGTAVLGQGLRSKFDACRYSADPRRGRGSRQARCGSGDSQGGIPRYLDSLLSNSAQCVEAMPFVVLPFRQHFQNPVFIFVPSAHHRSSALNLDLDQVP